MSSVNGKGHYDRKQEFTRCLSRLCCGIATDLTFQNKYVLYDHAEFMNCVMVVILRVC